MSGINAKFDEWFTKIEKYVTARIGSFAAFSFLLYAAGALTTITIMTHCPNQAFLIVLIPAVTGAISYYNRAFATIAFFILMIGLLLF
ncbi:MAG: hypothetical protein WC915_02875 [archaeon]|jgi:hypothetical protein